MRQEDSPGLAARVTALEERVAELAVGDPVTRAPSPGETGVDPHRFWAVAELRRRTGDGGGVLFAGSLTLPGGSAYAWQQGAALDALLEADWSLAKDVLGALGHPVRLVVLREVLRGAQTVAELGATDGLGTTGQLYHHLRQLVAAGWLRTAGRGRYEVPAARVVALLVVLTAAQR